MEKALSRLPEHHTARVDALIPLYALCIEISPRKYKEISHLLLEAITLFWENQIQKRYATVEGILVQVVLEGRGIKQNEQIQGWEEGYWSK